ncbi:aminotransferase class I/II-fold pyridoxal phosphate-dependent enzyme [Labilibacter sediminis]|nr:aminotransferase class I/II-fold pyridoxal phosphate-dependent enzyme [Labilibacter sediminis]
MLIGHGNHTADLNKSIQIDFSSNIWYGRLNNDLLKHLQLSLAKICNYPTVDASDLQKEVAGHYHLNQDNVCVTSGATEAFYLIAHAFKNCSSSILCPSFSEYTDAANMYQHEVSFVSNSEVSSSLKFISQLVWIGNPNNPDAKLISPDTIEDLLKGNPQSIFIIDEAYGELCYGFQSAEELIGKYENLVVIKSVTKLCSIPGLRLGYILSNADLIKKVAAYRMPWSVSTMALEAGRFIFKHYSDFSLDTKQLNEESLLFQKQLAAVDGLKVYPSPTNYFLIELHNRTAAELKEYLVDNYGILIRDCANFYGLSKHHFRLAIQGKANNELCVEAISKFIHK